MKFCGMLESSSPHQMDRMPNSKSTDQPWFSVRCILHHRHLNAYEERITLWRAADIDQAVTQAEQEGRDYAHDLPDAQYAELAQAYQLVDAPGDGNEVFSLIRDSSLPPDTYITTFFDTGTEHQQTE